MDLVTLALAKKLTKKDVDSTLIDYTDKSYTNGVKSKLLVNPNYIKAGQTIKSVSIKHANNS